MTNSLDYLKWRGDITIEQSPVNEVDLSLFCYFSTMDLRDILTEENNALTVKETAKLYKEKNRGSFLGALQPEKLPQMVELVSISPRFASLILCDYEAKVDKEINEQFGAVTILLPDGTFCVSFQGTDDTLIGWKEDCYLAISNEIEAQKDARNYLQRAAKLHKGKIRICGHSKGGNIAVSASVSVPKEIRDRIIEVRNSDGPGFSKEFLKKPEYLEMKDRITTMLSQHSLIGILLNRPGNIKYAKSCVSGPYAHDIFNWEVEGTSFIESQGLGRFESKLDRAVNNTIEKMTTEEKILFVENLFKSLKIKGANTVTDLKKMKNPDLIQVLISLGSDKSLHKFASSVLIELAT